MMDFNERVIPNVSSNFMFKEALARYEFARKFLKKGFKVLDIGCGTGYGAAFLINKDCKVVGVDINKDAINYAREHYGRNVTFIKGSADKLEFEDSQFDVVCSFEVIEHLVNVSSFLKETKRVLKKGGLFVLSTPNTEKVTLQSPYHTKEYDYQEFKKLLNRNFDYVKIYGQMKSDKAIKALDKFMDSQKVREKFAKNDLLGLRKLFPKEFKEKIWKYLGNFFGRKSQEYLNVYDFPIKNKNIKKSYYFIAVCRK